MKIKMKLTHEHKNNGRAVLVRRKICRSIKREIYWALPPTVPLQLLESDPQPRLSDCGCLDSILPLMSSF